MSYKTGHIPWNTGKPRSEETKRKIGETRKLRGHKPWNTGKKWSTEVRDKISNAHMGKTMPEEQRLKMIGKYRGSNSSNWTGGKIDRNGYTLIFCPEHPNYKDTYVPEHRLVAEKAIGRYLKSSELVHHFNGNKKDNRNCNLLVCDNKYHLHLHNKMGELYMRDIIGPAVDLRYQEKSC